MSAFGDQARVRSRPKADVSIAALCRREHRCQMTDKPPKTPQDKKALSYAKDRRNTYGENDKSSRKAIPARKAGESRKVRRKANQALTVVERLDEEAANIVESSLKQDVERVGGWTKSPDEPLAVYLQLQARRRSWRDLAPNRTPSEEPDVC